MEWTTYNKMDHDKEISMCNKYNRENGKGIMKLSTVNFWLLLFFKEIIQFNYFLKKIVNNYNK